MIAVLSALLLATISHRATDGFMIRYPFAATNEFEIEENCIPGATTNLWPRLDAQAAQAMAGTADAFVQRIVFGEAANFTMPVADSYADFNFSPHIYWYSNVNLFNPLPRDFRGRVRISRSYDEACACLLPACGDQLCVNGRFDSSLRDFRGDGPQLFYWASSAFDDPGLSPRANWGDDLLQAFGGLAALADCWPNFSDVALSGEPSERSARLIYLLSAPTTGYGDYFPRDDPDLSGIGRRWLRVNGMEDTLRTAFSGRTVRVGGQLSTNYFDLVRRQYGDAAVVTQDWTFFRSEFPRISWERFALANQMLGLLDETIAGWTVGQRPLYVHELKSAGATLEYASTNAVDWLALTVERRDGEHRFCWMSNEFRIPTTGGVYALHTNSVEIVRSRVMTLNSEASASQRGSVMAETEPGSLWIRQIDGNPVDSPEEAEVILAGELHFGLDGRVYIHDVPFAEWGVDEPMAVSGSWVGMSVSGDASSRRLIEIAEYAEDAGGVTNSVRARYPVRAAFSNALVKDVTQLDAAFVQAGTYDAAVDCRNPNEWNTERFAFAVARNIDDDWHALDAAALATAGRMASRAQATMLELSGAQDLVWVLSKDRLRSALTESGDGRIDRMDNNIDDNVIADGWDAIRFVALIGDDDVTFQTYVRRDGVWTRCPGGEMPLFHLIVAYNTFAETADLGVTNAVVIGETAHPRRVKWNFNTMKGTSP